jgi:predicted ATPase
MAKRAEPFRGTFFGRDDDLDAVKALVTTGGARLVTLLGPGGVGKTRLLHRLATRFDATVFCDLSSARTREEVTALAAASLGGIALGAATTADTAVARVGAALAKRGALVFEADNLEQLDEGALSVLAKWLSAAPELVVLATSRVRLGIAGEVVHRVAPLPEDQALLLFEDRASAVRGRALDEAERLSAKRIVTLLEGVPLALEMAATRLAVLGADELLARLSRPLAVLASGARTDPDRHASMSRVLDGSWELLPEAPRRVLVELAVFAGGFTIDAVEAVSLDRDAVVDAVARLVDSSLARDQPARSKKKRLALYEVVREYALERLSAEKTEIERRHALHFASWGEARARGDEAALLELIDDEANLSAASAFAARTNEKELHLRLLVVRESARMLRGSLDAWTAELEASLEGCEARSAEHPESRLGGVGGRSPPTVTAPSELRSRVEHCLARALHELGRTEAAKAAYAKAIEGSEPSLKGSAMCGLGRLLVGLGEWGRGLALFREARAIEGTSPAVRAFADACYAFYGTESGASKAVSGIVAAYVDVCRHAGDPRELAFWLVQLGRVESELDRARDKAEEHIGEGLAIARRLGDLRGEGFALFGLGSHRVAYGDAHGAATLLADSARLLREAGTRRYEGWALGFLGNARAALRQSEAAIAAFDSAIALLRDVGDTPREALLAAFRGTVHARSGDELRASEDFARAREIAPASSLYHAWTIDLCAAQLEVARARAGGSPADVAANLSYAKELLSRATWTGDVSARRDWPWGQEFFEPRLAASLLESAIEDVERPPDALRVAFDGSSFNAPREPAVSLASREKPRRVLLALARARSEQPGKALGVDDLMAAAWPGERVKRESAQNRVHVALDALRKLGLRDLVVRGEGGWMLDPAVPFAWD